MAEARVTGTRHLLPFVQLDPGAFERLCFGLVSRRPGYHSVEHPGAAGRDHGCDIAALRDVDDGTERVYVQCKRIGRPPGPAMFKTEIDKVAGAVASGSLDRPDVLLFIVTQNISVEVRRDAVQHAKTVGLRAEFLALTELDAEVSRHADLVEQFFQLPGAVRGRSGGGSPFDWMTPRQLGAPWGTFVNRANELAELDRAVRSSASPQTPRVLVLSGPTGAGKSRLAEEWARSQAVNFPDGQLRLDLRRTRRSRTLANALRSSLEAFGCPAKSVPERLEDRQALFRSLTADRSVLLLLDNADEPGDVQGLLPSASDSLVLVTTNTDMRLLKAGGATQIPVGTLDLGHARTVLHALVGSEPVGTREREASEQVQSYCGGLPLALEMCATQIRDEGGGSYGWLAARLADERTRLERIAGSSTSLDVVFGTAYRALPDDLARAYRLIAQSPRMSTWGQVLAVLGTDEMTGRPLVSKLASRNLIEFRNAGAPGDDAVERLDIGMHDLLRLHGRTVSLNAAGGAAESTELVRRIGSHAAARSRQIDRAISPDRLRVSLPEEDLPPGPDSVIPTGADATRRFAVERAFLLAAQEESAAGGEDAAVCVIADALWPAMYGRGWNDDIADVFETGVRSAERLGNRRVLCRLRMLLARGLGLRGEYADALEHSHAAIELARAERDDWLLASALEVEGLLLLDSRGPEHALEVFQESRAAFPAAQVRGRAIQDHCIGICHARLGRPHEAADAFTRAVHALAPLEDHVLLARSGWRLAEALAADGRPDEALGAAAAAFREATVAGEYSAQGHAMLTTAALSRDDALRRKHLASAIEAFGEAADEAGIAEARRRLEALGPPAECRSGDGAGGQASSS